MGQSLNPSSLSAGYGGSATGGYTPSGRPLIDICPGMGLHFPGQMGAVGGQGGVPDRVYRYTAYPHDTEIHSTASRPRSKSGTTEGSGGAPVQGGDRPGLSPLSGGFLVHLFSGSEKDRRLETHPEPEAFEQVYQTNQVQDGNSRLRASLPHQRQVGSVAGLEGCIPPRPYLPAGPEMVTFQAPRPGLCIPMPSFRSVDLAQGVYLGGEVGRGLSETQGSQRVHVSRRLAHLRPFDRRSESVSRSHGPNSGDSGVYYQCEKVQIHPVSIPTVLGGAALPQGRFSSALARPGVQPDRLCPNPSGFESSSSSGLAQSSGPHGQHGGSDPVLSVSHACDPDPPPCFLQSQSTPDLQISSNVGSNQGRTRMVATQTQPDEGSSFPHASGATRYHDRCIQVRLGGSPSRHESLGAVVSPGSRGSHQCSGAVGGGEVASQVPNGSCRMQCIDSVRQFNGSSLPEQTGRDKVSHPMSAHSPTPTLVSGQGDNPQGNTHSGRDKPPGGRPLKRKVVKANRVVSRSTGCPDGLRQDVSSIDRPVRIQRKQKTSSLLHQGGRSSGIRSRRPVNRLGGDDGLCFSSNLATTSCSGQDSERGLQRHPHSSILAKTSMVSGNGRPANEPTPLTTAGSRSPQTSGGSSSQSALRAPDVDCVAFIRQRCQESGFSERSATLIAAGRRESTLRTYSKRLAPYVRWCNERGLSPTRAPVSKVADFLSERFDSGLESATVRNYKSAILSIHRGFDDGTTINDDGSIRLLLEGMFNTRPPSRKVVPMWDLNSVLDYLKGPPFEPLSKATLKYLTLKTIMLVALASARRCSELHALSASLTNVSDAGATLFFRPGFTAKNERSNFQHSTLFLPRMGVASSIAEDRWWCPARTVQYYLKRTRSLRGNDDNFFITHADPHKSATKQTLARWLVQVIVDAGAVQQGSHPLAHSTRSVAASWAYHRGLTVAEICQAVSWKAPSTFSTTYYRNVENGDLRGQFARSVLARSGRN